ncbi:glycerol kinase [Spiroplasma sp. NBRC 100390]|uniref:glycerol kinase GlpK n=1 Tax=unclassified Spiroplasma TaxID=2637901 RepID=UPI0008927C74|nr:MULTISPECIES: glycerol kinase GlpK [unclassified Spiroplasma]AOX44161.1 glycerol kinase [Spiroplasma sp. TU-14]APE13631.1 glycerol kinase [Spiroplasma sp. NBRC 100390]
MSKYIISLDEGTTSCRTLVINYKGEIVASDALEFSQIFPKAGWVEHDAVEIWNSQRTTLVQSVNKAKIKPEDIVGIGITNQRETVVMWDKRSGLPIYNAIVWQDRRTTKYCDELIAQGKSELVQTKTGLIINPYFSATKIKWILDNVEGARQLANDNNLLFGTIDTWLIYRLTGGKTHVTDSTNASRTMLFNIHTKEWDEELLNLMDIPKGILPTVKSSSEVYGHTFPGLLSKDTDIQIPIASAIGDQQAALFGQLCLEPGEVKNTYGTGCFILMNTGQTPIKSNNGLLTTIALDYKGTTTYALEGSVFVAGAAVQWLRDQIKIIYHASETDWYTNLVNDDQQVYVVPSFTGLGSPYWDSYSRGAIFGLERGTKREHLVKATLESLAYQSYDVIMAMAEDLKKPIKRIKVDGGASRNEYLMQFQADITQVEVIRPKSIETTAMGAAFLAGLAVNFWTSRDEIKQILMVDKKYNAKLDQTIVQKLLKGWKVAVNRTLNWLKDIE